MYASSTFIFSAIVALARIAAATPPACLISALGVQPNPADLKALCGSLEPALAGNITEKCHGDDVKSAQSVFSSTCLASESVTISFTSSASHSSKTGSASVTTTASSHKSTATGTSGSSATATGSGSDAEASSASTGSGSGSDAEASSGSTGSGSGSSAKPTATGSGAAALESGNAGSFMNPQSGFIMAPLALAAGFAGQYLL